MSEDQQRIGDYLILERLGRGPGAAAFRALDTRDGRGVMIRQAADGPRAPDLLRREIEILSKVRHPSIVRLIDHGDGDGDGLPYCVLAREEGTSLDRLPADTRAAFGQRALLDLLDPLLGALARLHEAGFLHGDISPRNIVLRRDGQPVLVDFGAAEPLLPDPDMPPAPISTPGFAAPERGSADGQGPWTDLYSLAAVAFWLIAGRPPPMGGTAAGGAAPRDLGDDGAAPRDLGDGGATPRDLADGRFSAGFLAAIEQALAGEAERRPSSAEAWREILMAAPPPAKDDGPTPARLAGSLRDRLEVELPPPDEVPATVRLGPDRHAALALRPPPDRAPRRGPAAAGVRTRGRGGRRLASVVLLLVLAAALGAGGWWGWTWYDTTTKRVWLVDPGGGGDAVSIAEAVAGAAAGSTIRIAPGTYAESLTIERPLHLEPAAEGAGSVVISPPAGHCVLFRAPAGSLRGLTFQGGDGTAPCLELAGGEVRIQGVTLGPWQGTGLLIVDGADPLIKDNRFADIDGAAILIERGGRGRIEDNRIERTAKSAITARGGAAPTVQGNRIEQAAQAGLLIDQGAGGVYIVNEIVGSGASAIEVRGGAAPRVARNVVENPAQAGLFVHGGARGEFLGNRIEGSGLSGAVVSGGAAPRLADNEIRGSAQHGVLVVGAAAGRIERNRIEDNRGHGIVLGKGTTTKLEENELSRNRKPQLRRLGE